MTHAKSFKITNPECDRILKAMEPKILLTLDESGKPKPPIYFGGGID